MYIALKKRIYISSGSKKLEKIGYESCCKELLVLKHKTKYSCGSEIYFNLGPNVIKKNFNFD